MSHVLEHLGQDTQTYLKIWKEIYRVCKNGSLVHIFVPHPRHNHFIGDPTHIRPITQDGLELFSKKFCAEYRKMKAANTPLAEYLDIDFDIIKSVIFLDEYWDKKVKNREINSIELEFCCKTYNNVIKASNFVLQAVKS